MKAQKQTSVKIKFNSEEYHMFMEIVRKVINGEAPLHEIGILTAKQTEFLKNLEKLLK